MVIIEILYVQTNEKNITIYLQIVFKRFNDALCHNLKSYNCSYVYITYFSFKL